MYNIILNFGSSGYSPSPRLGMISFSGKRCFSHGNNEIPIQSSTSSMLQHLAHCLQGKERDILGHVNAAIKGMSFSYGKNFLIRILLENRF